jgi:hypothetical protein
MMENQSRGSVISKDLPSLANEAAARSCFLVVFLTPASGNIIKDAEAVIITSEMARN